MTLEELLEQYEAHKLIVKHNGDGDWDYDASVLNIKFEIGKDFEGSATKKLEDSTIKQLQDVFDRQGWELKNATAGIKDSIDNRATLLVEHHQHKRIEDETVPSGILVTKSGYWWYGIDDIGFFVLKTEFLLWCYEYKLQIFNDGPIASQKGGNQGFAFLIPYSTLPYLFSEYKKHLTK